MHRHSDPPPVDPEADGIPAYADDDSTAYDDDSQHPRSTDDVPALPTDRPLAVDEFGTTAEEQRQGETMESRLRREEPDVPIEDPLAAPGGALADEAVGEVAAAQAARDAEVLGTEPEPLSDPHSPVSAYDMPDPQEAAPVGRLVAPDQGAYSDTEKDEVAYDAGRAGGGFTAEEAAMHIVPDDPPR